ncbi:hypothetical protein JTB14_035291 [Gonioctena quinquepunctata]|nr:hypothetical protein JTB14_035291 [Gonioctena quinquepunctata]
MTRSTKKVDEELQSIVETLVTKLCTSKDFPNELTTSITFQEEITQLKKENEKMNKKSASQEEQIKTLSKKQEHFQQQIRKRNALIYGIEESNQENCANMVLDIFSEKIKLQLDKSFIENCYRIRKASGRARDTKYRPIIVLLPLTTKIWCMAIKNN